VDFIITSIKSSMVLSNHQPAHQSKIESQKKNKKHDFGNLFGPYLSEWIGI